MSANQRKIAILKTLLERVQQRAAAPRTAAKVAAVALAASAPAEAARPVEDEPTPLVPSSALAEALPLAEEPTPSEDIVVVELSPSPGPAAVAEDEAQAARISEALSSEAEDEPPASSKRSEPHPLEAAMAPMELDPISDRPTARITLPPEADPDALLRELPKAPVPVIEEPEAKEDQASAPAPEITVSSEAAEELSFEDELIELGEADEAPPAAQVEPSKPAEPAEPVAAAITPAPASGVTTVDAAKPAAEEELDFEDVIVLEESDAAPPVAPVEAKPVEAVQAAPVAPVEEKPAPAQEEPRKLEAEVVQRPAAAETEVTAVVGKVEPFAPKTFGELLDASLEL